ncbi:RDD family protein [Planobispora takensis]|uniref:RDD domain-containing protein n=1 Tax=Planobispora takensis TaxID=1367882 RepID=A0A8J3SSQ7_9ACTN|nr:RDD family protein [Planobispora takensis]GIH98172.1 hypothetical protein Pta02_01810 [Planobispora takensis]
MTPHGVSPVPREARPYQGHRAGVVSRFLAAAVDLAVVIGAVVGVYAVWATLLFLLDPLGFSFPRAPVRLSIVTGFVILVLYLAGCWATTGRTFGNHLMGLRAVNFRGERMRLAGALVRAVAYAVFPIGLFWVAVSRDNRSLADLVLRTSVIYDWLPVHPPSEG